MQSLNESLSFLLKAINKNSEGGIKTNVQRPDLIHSFDLENMGLLSKEVIMGIPKLKINFLSSCGYQGCTPSHCEIHVRERVEFIDDLQRYEPVMMDGDEGEKIEELFKEELDQLQKNVPLYKKVTSFKLLEEEFPKTSTQKIKRKLLKEMIMKG